MLYSRYGSPQFVLEMDVDDGIQMINEIYKKINEEKAYQLYLSIRPSMTEETYQTFEQFYTPQKKQEVVEDKSVEEILNDVKELMDSHSWR